MAAPDLHPVHRAPIHGCYMTWKGFGLAESVDGALSVSEEPVIWASVRVRAPPPEARKTCNSCGRAKERSPPTAKTGGELAAGRRPEFSGSGEPSAPVDLRRAAH